ncbi:MAG: orotidine-5'-phosphate decarboxylase [Chloroflexi bacterium]|nr:orotidine-5'-phosphate decarboxylase [Chloroflexota bacterium]
MPQSPFRERLASAMDSADSLICVGLDPQPNRTAADEILSFNTRVIEATADLVCAYKPQSAFYEVAGELGWRALRDTIGAIRRVAPHAFVILDAKRNDIGNTAEAYARAAFDWFGADALTVNPYLGGDAVAPFLQRPDRGAFALCRTSNPGAGDLQSLRVGEGEPLYLSVASLARGWAANNHDNLGLVVGATWPDELAQVRARCPDMPILLPGVGAQGGDLEASVAAGVDGVGRGLLVSASRSVIYAGDEEDIRAAARDLRAAANAAKPANISS